MQAKLFRHTNAAKASKDGLDYTNLSSQREIKYNKHFGANETYKIDSMLTVSNKTNEFLSALEMYATNRSVIEAIVSSRENCFPWKTNHPAIIIEPIKIVLTDGNQVRRIR